MPEPINYYFPRYLAAKQSVDDRALNHYVWQTLHASLPLAAPQTPLRVVEIGAGIGTMLPRMLERETLTAAHYTAIDQQAENIAYAQQHLDQWAVGAGYRVSRSGKGLHLIRDGIDLTVILEAADIFEFFTRDGQQQKWDLLIGHAFLDLLDIPSALPQLFSLLNPEGLFFFSVNFDGLTILEPAIDPAFDELIYALYHRSMDERLTNGKPSGDSRAGRHLFTHLKQSGAQILAAGASDWVVFPTVDGYLGDEAYFLHFIVNTIHQALTGHPVLDPDRFEQWIATRHAQVEQEALVYIAHQLDFVGQVPTVYST